jgi:hypothetical protein
MARQSRSITSLPRSPEEDRRRRMIRYSVTMGIRLVCVLLCIFVRGWWLLVCAAGAVILPYIAVVLANIVDSRVSSVERPGAIVPLRQEPGTPAEPRAPEEDGRP